jgi:hypothetical protein
MGGQWRPFLPLTESRSNDNFWSSQVSSCLCTGWKACAAISLQNGMKPLARPLKMFIGGRLQEDKGNI